MRRARSHAARCEQARDEIEGRLESVIRVGGRNGGAHGNAGWRRDAVLPFSRNAAVCRRPDDRTRLDYPRRRRPQFENQNVSRSADQARGGGCARTCRLISIESTFYLKTKLSSSSTSRRVCSR